MGAYLGGGVAADDPRVSPLHVADLAGVAPACVITAACDPLKDEGAAWVAPSGLDLVHPLLRIPDGQGRWSLKIPVVVSILCV